MENKNDVATIALECVRIDDKPTLSFNGVPYYSASFKDFNGFNFNKAFKEPISLGLHKFSLHSYKGKLSLKYIAPL